MPITLASSSLDPQTGARFEFRGGTEEEVADRVHEFLVGRKYRLESGDDLQGVWGRGSDALHFLLGAFAGRVKFDVKIDGDADHVVVTMNRAMSGVMGGAWGMMAQKKKLKALAEALPAAVTG
jgi:hypothetical protein